MNSQPDRIQSKDISDTLSADTRPVRIGMVGFGRLGQRHAENFALRVPGCRLVALVSPSETSRLAAQAAFPGIETHSDLESMLARDDIDAVCLVTPTSLHADQIIAVLESGRHVFCDKPLALEIADCDRVIAAARSYPSLLAMVGFNRRFDPAYAEAKQRVARGEIGDVLAISCRSEDPIDKDGRFLRFAPTSGGIFLDACIHDIDLVRWILDGAEATHVTAVGGRMVHPTLADCNDVDTAFATATFAGGPVASFHVSRTAHRGYETTVTIHGSRGAIEIGRGINHLPLMIEAEGVRSFMGQVSFLDRFNDAFINEARAFVAAIREQQPSPLSLEDAREATKLAARMQAALIVS